MWAFVTLGLLWIEQPSLGAPEALRTRLDAEAHTLSGAVLTRQAKLTDTCNIDALGTFDMDLSLCDVSLRTDPLLIFERTVDDHGVWMRLVFVEHGRITRSHETHMDVAGDATAVASTLLARMFADYGEVV